MCGKGGQDHLVPIPSSSLSPMPYHCDICSLSFDNKNLYITHRKKCVPAATIVAHTSQVIDLTHNNNKVFLCYCSNSTCPKPGGFTTADALQRHMKTLKTKWLGMEAKASVQSIHISKKLTCCKCQQQSLCNQSISSAQESRLPVSVITTHIEQARTYS